MKIAILGASPLALECALRFHLHGAALTWYRSNDSFTAFTSRPFEKDEFISDLGISVLKEMNKTASARDWQSWQEDYERPLIAYLKAHQEVKDDEVVSVTKRFLAPKEEVKGSSRFHDLFRVIFRVNPKDFIEQQKESNPETYQRLTEEFLQSLTSTIEMYQDYDLVLDLRAELSRASLAVTGRALGETRETDKLSHGLSLPETKELREVALIGSGGLSAEILIKLEEWLKDERSRLFVVSHEENPFEEYLNTAHPLSASRLQAIFTFMKDEFEKDITVFTKKLREWQELDDFVQAKIPKPGEPIPRLVFFSGHNVTAIDELIDRRRMFLTLEKPDFRDGKLQPENNELDLKTIGVDHVMNAHAQKPMAMIQLDTGEKGYFNLSPHLPNTKDGWITDLRKLSGIEDEIFKLFSPASAH